LLTFEAMALPKQNPTVIETVLTMSKGTCQSKKKASASSTTEEEDLEIGSTEVGWATSAIAATLADSLAMTRRWGTARPHHRESAKASCSAQRLQ
jgi:hypothetical protein